MLSTIADIGLSSMPPRDIMNIVSIISVALSGDIVDMCSVVEIDFSINKNQKIFKNNK
ncbi:MAG: hypothetical protein ACFFB8_11500 [Promethearchaeota archaeon]